MPEADGHDDDFYSRVAMISYNNEQAKSFTDILTERTGFGCLQAWTTDPMDPQKHAENIISRGMDVAALRFEGDRFNVLDIGCGTGEMLYQACELYPDNIASAVGVNLFESQLPPPSKTPHPLWFRVGNFETDQGLEEELQLMSSNRGYGYIMINYAIGHFDNLADVFLRVHRLLAKDGVLSIYDIGRASILYDTFLDYHLYSACEIRMALYQAGLYHVTQWKTDDCSLDEALLADESTEESLKQFDEWDRKTKPIFFTAWK